MHTSCRGLFCCLAPPRPSSGYLTVGRGAVISRLHRRMQPRKLGGDDGWRLVFAPISPCLSVVDAGCPDEGKRSGTLERIGSRMRERVYTTEALILRRHRVGESDRLLMLCTPQGKRYAIARGARKPNSRLAGHLELFTAVTMMLAVGRTMDIVTQSTVAQSFPTLHAHLSRLSYAYYLAELYDHLTHGEQEAHADLFSLLLQTFSALDREDEAVLEIIIRTHELQLLSILGYRPHFHHCALCHDQLTAQANRFSPAMGGVLCPRDAGADPRALPMSPMAFEAMRSMQREPQMAIEQLRLSPPVQKEIELLLRSYLRTLLERELRTIRFLESVRAHSPSEHPEKGIYLYGQPSRRAYPR